ncbi:MAG: HPr-rel-A system PqqD family peptide chaperone [Gammaproteobacteria bacterium]|nr:HPr-rel-A system PqqD family peptide chaperone [Gammaproteobacteria bacterium]
MTEKAAWHLADAMSLIARALDDRVALFDENSGSTLVFDIMSAEILLNLKLEPTPASELSLALARQFDVEWDSDLEEQLTGRLTELEAARLIKRVDEC